ncbi:MAG: sigma 54-interacting transcriptional regulator [Deltaproteobacteria bacterium]|nr:sigma 54-interacting transcriptional regulator [Deltaproteobacteria bacterium]
METATSFWGQLDPFREILDSARNGIVIVDITGTIHLFNQVAREVLAIQEPNLIGQHISSISEEAWHDMRMILKTGRPQLNKKITIGGSIIIANRTPIAFKGRIIGVLSIFQDIFEYDKISSELVSFKQLTMQLDAIIESSYDGLYITDGEANTLRVNQAYERISGLKREDLIGRNMKDLVQEGVLDRSVTLEVLRLREPVTIMQDIAGDKHVIVTGNPFFDKNGDISLVVTNVRDITELNHLHLELEETRKISSRYQEELEELQKLEFASHELIAKSETFRATLQEAVKVSQVNATVLITGESGVGKSLLARLIHRMSQRKDGSFIKISCGAIPETLMESELFGYEKGAFTGARREGKAGLLEVGNGGTVFLDEIGELPLNLQVKLLDVLEDKEITRLGGTTPRQIDLRLITATSRNLKQMVREGHFREDLFFRLNVIPLHIPPLRERKEAIIPLIDHFLQETVKATGNRKLIAPEVYETLLSYPFYGNVRELMNMIERMAILSEEEIITLKDLPPGVKDKGRNMLYEELGESLPLGDAVAKFEKEIIREAISTHGTISKAAETLGVNQSTLSRKAKKYHIRPHFLRNMH